METIVQKKRKILEGNIPNNSILILVWKKEQIRNGDVMYPFRQDSNILLLTRVNSPDIFLVWVKKQEKTEWILYSDPISENEKIWWTSRLSHNEIRKISWIEDIRPIDILENDLWKIIKESKNIYMESDTDYLMDNQVRKLFWKKKVLSPSPLLKLLRIIKTPEEIDCIREAIRVTKVAFDLVRNSVKPGMYEYEIEALISSIFRSYHLTEAYPTIVASGPNACTLHYIRHDRKIEIWDSILIDAWAEYYGYAADITRVYFASQMTDRQKEIYHSVKIIKDYAVSLIYPGVKKSDYEKNVRERMNEELKRLGLITHWISQEKIELLSRKYYPHSVSHFLGLDVHDIWERDEIYQSGMIITCEPGIYIPEEGIGIRLEDDIRITDDGCENLSKMVLL